MKRHPEIEKELKEISPVVAEVNFGTLFYIPSGYFEGLPEQVLLRIQSKHSGTESPANEEIHSLSPTVAGLKHQPSLSVPPGFFDRLPQIVLDKIKTEERTAPVIQLNPGVHKKSMFYVAAASVIGITLIGSLFFLFINNNQRPSSVAQSDSAQENVFSRLPGVEDNELADFLSAVPDASVWMLDNTDTDVNQAAYFTLDDANFSELSKDISDETLHNYEQEIFGQVTL